MKVNEMNDEDKELLRSRLKERRLFLGMTYQQLADKTGISKSSLQRYENGGIKNLSYDKIYKLAEALEVSVQYFADLSNDYTGEIVPIETQSISRFNRANYMYNIKKFEFKALQKITPTLISNGYSVEQNARGELGDLIARKGNKVWHIDFLYTRDVSEYLTGIGAGKQQLIMRFGRLSLYNKPITKYSIVMERRQIAEQFLRFNPTHLDVEISLIILKEDGFEELFFTHNDKVDRSV